MSDGNTRLVNPCLLEVCRILREKRGIHAPRAHDWTARGSLPWWPASPGRKDCRLIPPQGNRRLLSFKPWFSPCWR
jgi:hypothetical protein